MELRKLKMEMKGERGRLSYGVSATTNGFVDVILVHVEMEFLGFSLGIWDVGDVCVDEQRVF